MSVPAPVSREGSYLAFDFGIRRIGTAVGNGLLRRAQPLRTLPGEGPRRWQAIAEVLAEWQPGALVVGVPRHPDGAEHENTRRAERFARQLEGRYRLPVHRVDERYSTVEARRDGAADLDAGAAAVILAQYLDSLP